MEETEVVPNSSCETCKKDLVILGINHFQTLIFTMIGFCHEKDTNAPSVCELLGKDRGYPISEWGGGF